MAARLEFETWVPFPLERVFRFFADPNNLPRIMPAETGTRIDRLKLITPSTAPVAPDHDATLAGVGTEIFTSFKLLPPLPFRATWIAVITEFEWEHHFADEQRRGPFRRWRHRHEFAAETRSGTPGTSVRDLIEYEAGFGAAGRIAERFFISRQLQRTFAHRQEVLASLLQQG